MIKIRVDKNGEIITAEPVEYMDIYLNWDLSDGVVFENGEYRKTNDSDIKSEWLLETIKKAREHKKGKFIVNITTKNKKRYAVVHKASEGIDYDEERGDKVFNNLEEAEAYANEINNFNF